MLYFSLAWTRHTTQGRAGAGQAQGRGLEKLVILFSKVFQVLQLFRFVRPIIQQLQNSPHIMSLRLINESELDEMLRRTEDAVDATTLAQSKEIVDDVKLDAPNDAAFIRHAIRLRDLKTADQPYTVSKEALKQAYNQLPENERVALRRMCDRIRTFASAQRSAIQDISIPIPGGRAGHRVQPVRTAGCYAPGGRYPLPSSVLMTAVTARVAGVENVWVASPNPAPVRSVARLVVPLVPLVLLLFVCLFVSFFFSSLTHLLFVVVVVVVVVFLSSSPLHFFLLRHNRQH